MLKEFRQFLLRGNVVDLAVGIAVGAAFGAFVNAIVADLLTPLVSMAFKVPDFSGFFITINESKFTVGHLLNVFISFLLVSTAIFFFVVKPMNVLIAKTRKVPPEDSTTKKCKECLSDIPIEAKRCAHCAQVVT